MGSWLNRLRNLGHPAKVSEPHVRRIEETVVPGKRLGRHVDLRTAGLRDSGGAPPLASTIVSVAHKTFGLPLNQGETGSCTGNSLSGCLNTIPHYQAQKSPQPRTLTERDAMTVYSAEEVLEGYGPYSPSNDQGGTGQYVCEAGQKLGWLDGFQVAAGIDEALRALVLRPVITGINWYTSFDTPSSSGLITIAPGATVRGGHEIVAVEVDDAHSLVWFVQSWGEWGVARPELGLTTGAFCMSFSTWQTLLGQGGDVTVPRTAAGWVAS